MRLGKKNSVRHISFGQRGGENFSGEVAGFVRIALAAAGTAAQAERDVVLSENVSETFDFASVWDREQNLIPLPGKLPDIFQHQRYGAVEARSRLRQEGNRRTGIFTARDAEVLDIGSGERANLLPPVVGHEI